MTFTILLLDSGVCLPFSIGFKLKKSKSTRDKSKLSVNNFEKFKTSKNNISILLKLGELCKFVAFLGAFQANLYFFV